MTICIGDQLLNLTKTCVMGILNCTPDSFYAPSRATDENDLLCKAKWLSSHGATIIDVGGCSTRPSGTIVSEEEEYARLRTALSKILTIEQSEKHILGNSSMTSSESPFLSLDTFRAKIAYDIIREFGPMIVNDVTEGADPAMFETVAELGVPYVLTSNQSNICDMAKGFANKVQQLRDLGQRDIILDPGFGFGKTLEDNFAILKGLDFLLEFELPILIGISRKSMIYKTLDTTPEESLNGTTVLSTLALQKLGNSNVILRVHDVKEAMELIQLISHNS